MCLVFTYISFMRTNLIVTCKFKMNFMINRKCVSTVFVSADLQIQEDMSVIEMQSLETKKEQNQVFAKRVTNDRRIVFISGMKIEIGFLQILCKNARERPISFWQELHFCQIFAINIYAINRGNVYVVSFYFHPFKIFLICLKKINK